MDTAAYARALWAILSGADAQIRPAGAVSGPVQGQAIFRVEFTAPSPARERRLGNVLTALRTSDRAAATGQTRNVRGAQAYSATRLDIRPAAYSSHLPQ
jgi:hypothetical protein